MTEQPPAPIDDPQPTVEEHPFGKAYEPTTMPPIGRFLTAIGVDPKRATDDMPRIVVTSDRVWVQYTGLVSLTSEELIRALQTGPWWTLTGHDD
jgi:hypothetical protein